MSASVPAAMDGWRLDRVLCNLFPGRSRQQVKHAIAAGAVCVDGIACDRPRLPVGAGSVLQLQLEDPDPAGQAMPPALPRIVFEDELLAVLDKPAGLVVHPGSGRSSGTLADALAAERPAMGALPRSGLAHRLDKDTSGLIAAGKTAASLRILQRQFRRHTAQRSYLAIVCGVPAPTGVIDRPLADDSVHRTRKRIAASGRRAVTRYAVVRSAGDYALLRCRLETGRTHQIRAHLEHIGHPIAGDHLYSRRSRGQLFAFGRQMLHASELELDHPATSERMEFASSVPGDFASALDALDLAC